ncbi:hypothetical protein SDC9_191977 [bioreactor metagenome]|uniref:Uncharacterized protein n=1 Tax=bioreactor metagenome TaxID=1076179 RepID=A0A645I0Y5_9ZZZZ
MLRTNGSGHKAAAAPGRPVAATQPPPAGRTIKAPSLAIFKGFAPGRIAWVNLLLLPVPALFMPNGSRILGDSLVHIEGTANLRGIAGIV